MENCNILIIEDDKTLNNGICFNFEMDGFKVFQGFTLNEGKKHIKDNPIDLIILDVNLPDGTGFDFCKKLRDEGYLMPVLFLTACDMEINVITGFRSGGDDYVTKPFSLIILRERVLALLRRFGRAEKESNVLKIDEFEFDFDKMTVAKDGINIDLAPTEYKLLKGLVQSKGKVMTRQKLLELIWDKEEFIEEHALTVNINRLRSKIEDNPSKPKYIKTAYGMGYLWAGEER